MSQYSDEIPLSDFQGSRAYIVQLSLPEADSNRLKSLGLFEGQLIQLQKNGSPLILAASGGRVAVAREIASHITVRASDDRAA